MFCFVRYVYILYMYIDLNVILKPKNGIDESSTNNDQLKTTPKTIIIIMDTC